MKTFRNDTYHYKVGFTHVNGNTYLFYGCRRTIRGGAVFDGNGKCLQHNLVFAGWYLTEYRIAEGEEIRQMWMRKDGTTFNTRRFESKAKLVEWVDNHIAKFEVKEENVLQ